MVNIVLHEPEMPANTGNIGRTCVATGSVLPVSYTHLELKSACGVHFRRFFTQIELGSSV